MATTVIARRIVALLMLMFAVLLPQMAMAQSALCRDLFAEAERLDASFRMEFPGGDVQTIGEPIQARWSLDFPDDGDLAEAIRLVLVAVDGTRFRTPYGFEANEVPVEFGAEWHRLGLNVHEALDTLGAWITPPRTGRFGLSWAFVAAHEECGAERVYPVGQAQFTIREEQWLAEPAICHMENGAGGGGPAVSVGFDVADGATLKAGDPVKVSWALDDPLAEGCDNPLFLVLTLPGDVRFAGEGFVALPPGAGGPYGIDVDVDRTRAFIPLHPLVEGAGDFTFAAYRTGILDANWHLVEVPRLAEAPRRRAHFAREGHSVGRASGASMSLTVVPGDARIVVQDRYAFDMPRKTFVSNSGQYLLQVFDRAYRVFDAGTNELLFERDGMNPHFSPTSRFLVSFFEEGFVVEIVDLATGEIVHRGGTSSTLMISYIHEIGWSEGDAFAVVLFGGRDSAQFEVVSTIADARVVGFWSGPSGGTDSAIIDFDQLIAYTSADPFDGNSFILPLTHSGNDDALYPDDPSEQPEADGVASSVYVNRIDEFDTRDLEEGWQTIPGMVATSDGPLPTSFVAGLMGRDPDFFDGTEDELRAPDIAHRELEAGQTLIAALDGASATIRGTSQAERAAFSLVKQSATTTQGRLLERFGQLVGFEARHTDPGTVTTGADIALGDGGPFDGFMRHLVETSEEIGWWREDQIELAKEEGRPEPSWFETAEEMSTAICPPQPDYIALDGIEHLAHWTIGGRSIWAMRYTCHAGVGVPTNAGVLYLIRERAGGYTVDILDGGHEGEPVDEEATADDEDWEEGVEEIDYDEAVAEWLGLANNSPVGSWLIDQRFLAFSTPSRTLFVYDLVEDRTTTVIRNAPGGDNVSSLHLSRDGRHLLQVNANGSLHVHDALRGERVLDGYFLDDEITVYDDSGRFDATPEGAHFLHVKFPGLPGYHSLDQFRSVLHRPEHLRAVLSGAATPPAAPQLAIPPDVELVIQPSAGGVPSRIEVSARSATGLAGLRLVADGKTVWSTDVSGASVSIEPSVALEPGVRWLAAVAVDANGLRSLPSTVAMPDTGAMPTGKLFALGVGTDIYTSPRIANLSFAAADARNFAASVEAAAARLYAEVEAKALIDPDDIAGSLDSAISDLAARAGEGDTIMMLVAGHGVRDEAGQFYLAGRNTRPDDIAGTAASWSRIAEALRHTKARVILFLDACHSGSIEGEATNDGAVEAFVDRGANIAVLAASKGRQFSFEQGSLRGGVFTTVLGELMRGDRREIDRNANGTVELSELYGVLKQRVVTMTNGEQTPWIARNEMIGEIPLY